MPTVNIDTEASDLWPAMPGLVAAPPPPPFPLLRLPDKVILRVADHLLGYDAFNPQPASRSLKSLAMANCRLRDLLLPLCWKVVTITGHVRKHKEQTGAILRQHGHLVENLLVVLDSTRPVILQELQLCSVLCDNVRTLNVLPPPKRQPGGGRGQGRGRRGGRGGRGGANASNNNTHGKADEVRSFQEMFHLLEAFAPSVEALDFKVFEPFQTSIGELGKFLAKALRLRTLALGVRSDYQLPQHEANLLVENLKFGGVVRDLTLAPKAIHAVADCTIADLDLLNLTHLRLMHDGVNPHRLRKVLVRFADQLEFVAFTGDGVDHNEHYPNLTRVRFPRLETVEYWRNQKNKILHRLIDPSSPVKTFLLADEQSGTLDEVKSFVANQHVPTVERVLIKRGKPKTSALVTVWMNGTTPYKNTVRQYERWGQEAGVAVSEGWPRSHTFARLV